MIKKIAVIGTGVIGTGWIIRCLAHNKKVIVFDKDLKLEKKLLIEIKRAWPFVKKLFNKKKIKLKNFSYVTSLVEALKDVDFIFLGDSFVEGACVEDDFTFAGLFRKNNYKV